MSGIVTSSREPVVLLFHTEEPSQQFYQDGFDSDGLYWYSGEGTKGDMTWTRANKSVRDHSTDAIDLFLFERVQRTGGLWRFSHVMRYFDHRMEQRPDKEGNPRKAIIFALLTNEVAEPQALTNNGREMSNNLADLRRTLLELDGSDPVGITERIQRVYQRSSTVSQHAKIRADGVCEACMMPAPFMTRNGDPFLEVHHIDRLADGGADKCDQVAAICPNCHRRCHYADDGAEYNHQLAVRIARIEAQASN